MAEWWSIEVFSGDRLPASGWRYAYEDELTEAAITHGAMYYEWHDTEYGVIFEVLFREDADWEAFRALPAVRAALDGVPDPVNGLIIYRGRGGAAGSRTPRKPKPAPGAAALELEEPKEERRLKFKVPRKLKYDGGGEAIDEALRELGIGAPGEDGPGTDAPGTDAPGTDAPGTGVPSTEVPGAEPVWRDIAAVDRSCE
jgi:hypothetical protein